MIEKFIKNEITIKNWRRFKAQKRAFVAVWILLAAIFFSFTAEIWSNNKPLVMKYNEKLYFPIFVTYHPTEFNRTDILVMDYRSLNLKINAWAIWPINLWDPYESNKSVDSYPAAPSKSNLFGTDDRGRDVLARLLYGFRYCIIYAFCTWMISFFLGIVMGALMGFFGGKVDLIGQRLVEVFESMPVFLLLLTIISIFSPNVFLLVIFTTLFGWMFISIYVRAEFLKLRKLEFVEAARALGASRSRVIFKHILPNALGPVLTFSPFIISSHIYSLASLDYLGFGLVPPTPSWGELMSQAQGYFTIAWWLAVYSSLFLFLTLVLLNLIGEGVRDALDPRKI